MANDGGEGGVRVSSWVAGIAAAVAIGAAGVAVNSIRTVDRLEIRVQVLERDAGVAAGVPAQLARLEEQMRAVQAELAKVNAKLDEKPRR